MGRVAVSLAGSLARHPWRSAIIGLALTAASMAGLARLSVDNSMEAWIDRDGTAWRQYQELVGRFGSDEMVLVVVSPPDLFEPGFFARWSDLSDRLAQVPGVARVDGLPALARRPFYRMLELGALEREVTASPLYRRFLISDDGRTGALWLHLAREAAPRRRQVVEEVRRAVAEVPLGTPVLLAGPPVVNVALDETADRASRRFFPLVFVVSGLVLFAVFRRPYGVLAPFASVGAGVAWTLGLLGGSGRTLDMVTVALPPVLWVLGLSTSIHLLERYRRLAGEGVPRRQAVERTLAELARPCGASALTTAAGFASLMTSSMPPVRTMGAFAALGVLLCLAANFLFFPLLAPRRPGPAAPHPAVGWTSLPVRRPWAVVAASLVLAAVGAMGARRLAVESDVLAFFDHDAPLAVTYREVLPELTGPYSLEVLWRPAEGPTRENLARLDELGRAVAGRPEVARALTAADLVAAVYQAEAALPPEAARLPPAGEPFERAWRRTRALVPEETASFVASDGALRLSILVRGTSSTVHRRLEEALAGEIERRFEPAERPVVTGLIDLLVDLQRQVVASQVASFAVAFLLIAPFMGLLLRSLRDGLAALPPNLLPVLLAAGGMGLFGVPLDPATVMIAAVALGVAVDDTIHVLVRYRRLRRVEGPAAAAGRATAELARPLAVTSLVAAAGFLVLTASDFTPLVHFGAVTAATLGAALLGDLLLLPALLTLTDSRRLPA